MSPSFQATLEVDLDAIAENYSRLSTHLKSGSCAAVVKAEAYGLGADPVAHRLRRIGCKHFFVATLSEGLALRTGGLKNVPIYVFGGVAKGEEKTFGEYSLSPVLNSLEQLERWGKYLKANAVKKPVSSILHIDTGMRRLGLTAADVRTLAQKPQSITHALVSHYMTHLACADTPNHSMNKTQLAEVKAFLSLLPKRKMSFVNSSGIYLGKDYHYDLARPGCALYGINPTPHVKNPMLSVAHLTAPILQIRELATRESVGYGATYAGKKGDRIATVGIGYADGYFRHLSNQGQAFIAGVKAPLVGRVSMDTVMFDITHIPPAKLKADTRVEFIGKHQSVDDLAKQAGTIGYEVLTRISNRVKRLYINKKNT